MLDQKRFITLTREINELVVRMKWWQLHGMEVLKFFARSALVVAGYFVFMQSSVWWKILGSLIMSYGYYGIVISGTHETRHSAFFKSQWANKIAAYFFADFLSSQSNVWWHHRHVAVHHAYTNVIDRDPQLFFFPWINKYVYLFLLPFLLVPWLMYRSVPFLWRSPQKLVVYFFVMISGWIIQVWLFSQSTQWWYALGWVFLTRSWFAPIFLHVAIFNHIALPMPQKMGSWLPHQSSTTRNLRNHWFLAGLSGNAFLECHIEHHLFPTLSNHMLAKIHPLVKSRLTEYGYLYLEQGYFECLSSSLREYTHYFGGQHTELLK